MNTTAISSESIARGISLYWEVAHRADDHQQWAYSWNQIGAELRGVWDAVNYSIGQREAIDDILSDINTLRALARAHARAEPESTADVNINRAFSGDFF